MLASKHAESLLLQTLYSTVCFSALPNAVALGIGRAPEALALCANGAVAEPWIVRPVARSAMGNARK